MANYVTYLDWSSIGRNRRWIDYGLLCMYESTAAIMVNANNFAYNPGTSTLSWATFQIRSPISGGVITVDGGSISAADGDLIYIRDVEHPFQNETKTISVGAPSAKDAKKPTNLFLGMIDGGVVYLLPSGGGSSVVLKFEESAFLPVEWAQDGDTPPAALFDLIDGNGTLRVRGYSSSADNELTFPWEVPPDLYLPDGIRYQVVGVNWSLSMTNAYAYFDLRGYAIDDNEPIDQSWGTATVVKPGGTYGNMERVVSPYSNQVDVSNLARGKLAMLSLRRRGGHIEDTFSGIFYAYALKLKWSRETGSGS